MIPKFKFWDKDEQYFITDATIVLNQDGSVEGLEYYHSKLQCSVYNDISYYELIQSTGLKDKNGVEIFEEDILKVNNSKGLVEFGRYIDDEYIAYGLDGWLISKEYNGVNLDTPLTECVLTPNIEVEVIGNQFEHPHLIKE